MGTAGSQQAQRQWHGSGAAAGHLRETWQVADHAAEAAETERALACAGVADLRDSSEQSPT